MEDNRKQILTSIEEEIALLKSRIASLEEKLLALSASVPAEDAGPIDLSEPLEAAAEAPVETPVEAPVDDLPDPAPAAAPEVKIEIKVPQPVADPEPIAEPEVPAEPEKPAEPEAPAAPAEPEKPSEPEKPAEPEAPSEPKPKKARSYKWMTDLPGVPVKNIRSAISLYDRALFINTLFKENYALYDKTISDLNAMETLDDAVSYIEANFPDWNLSSDAVYGFMMAIRKKLG